MYDLAEEIENVKKKKGNHRKYLKIENQVLELQNKFMKNE